MKDLIEDLMKTFKVDPPRFCLKCYALVTNCVKRGSVWGGVVVVGGGDCSNVISTFKAIALLFIYVFLSHFNFNTHFLKLYQSHWLGIFASNVHIMLFWHLHLDDSWQNDDIEKNIGN